MFARVIHQYVPMARFISLFSVVSLLFVLAACDSGDPDPPGGVDCEENPTHPDCDDGDPDGLTGTLYGRTNAGLHGWGTLRSLDLNAPSSDWEELPATSNSAFDIDTVVPAENVLINAYDFQGDPAEIEVRELDTGDVIETFEWPQEGYEEIRFLEASEDGNLIAGVSTSQDGSIQWVDVMRRSDQTHIGNGLYNFDGVITGLAWTPDGDLVVSLDFSSAENPEEWGGIGVIPADSVDSGTDWEEDDPYWEALLGYVAFSQDEGVPHYLAASSDGSEAAFSLAGDVWVMDLEPGATPHQITTNPDEEHPHVGPQFSPDGTLIAFVEIAPTVSGFDEQYVVPNHRSDPILIGDGEGSQFLLREETRIGRLEAWAP